MRHRTVELAIVVTVLSGVLGWSSTAIAGQRPYQPDGWIRLCGQSLAMDGRTSSSPG
jgi:hypothetical protein